MNTITQNVKFTRVANSTVAGSTDVNSSSVDMLGYGSCTFICALGSIANSPVGGAAVLKVQQSDADSPESWADVQGTASTAADINSDNKLLIVEVVNPAKQLLRAVVDRTGTGVVVDSIIALQAAALDTPVTQSASVLSCELHVSPIAGTA